MLSLLLFYNNYLNFTLINNYFVHVFFIEKPFKYKTKQPNTLIMIY